MDRKLAHVDIASKQAWVPSDFDLVRFRHSALPDVNFSDVDISSSMFGVPLTAPIYVSSMTGGTRVSSDINQRIAEAIGELGLAMGVGSQRISCEQGKRQGLGLELRRLAGSQPILANFGAANIPKDPRRLIDELISQVDANAIFIHLNSLQEALQLAGDTDWVNVADNLAYFIECSPVPVIVKEVGFGIDVKTAIKLNQMGVHAIDVAGHGGTRFDAIEVQMNVQAEAQCGVDTFKNWGQSTIECLQEIKTELPRAEVWASGGIRNGLDMAKSIALGARYCGVAGAILRSAMISTDQTIITLTRYINELKLTCFACGADKLENLTNKLRS